MGCSARRGKPWRAPGAAARICYNRKKINLSQVFAGQTVGIKQVDDRIWLASFMDYDLGYFDDETCTLEPLYHVSGMNCNLCVQNGPLDLMAIPAGFEPATIGLEGRCSIH
jgi:hypothetical protein